MLQQFETLWEAVRAQATARPDAPAILDAHGACITHGELWRCVDATVVALNDLGLGRGDVLAAALPQTAAGLAFTFAATATCALLPLVPDAAVPDLERALDANRVTALAVFDGATNAARSVAQRLGVPLIEVTTGVGGVFAVSRGTDSLRPAVAPGWACSTDPAVLRPTSGTTGAPTWTVTPQLALISRSYHIIGHYGLTPADRYLHPLSLPGVQITFALHSVVAGGSSYIGRVYDGTGFFAQWRQAQPTWYYAPPAAQRAILLEAEREGIATVVPAPRFIRSGGGPGTEALADDLSALFGATVSDSYQMTESYLIAAQPLPPRKAPPGSAGVLVAYDVDIVGPDGAVLPPGAEGEIVLRPPADPAHPWYRRPEPMFAGRASFPTGDLGRLDADGYLFVTGRLKEVIKRGGAQVSPLEVDEALLAHPEVAEAVTFGVPDPLLVEAVAAAVVLRPGATVGERELRQWAAERLAAAKVPARIHLVNAIPTSAAGKVSRRELAGLLAEQLAMPSLTRVAPATPLEEQLLPLWRKALGQPDLGVDDDYFALGGSSLTGALLMQRVGQAVGRDVPVETLWHASTVRRLAQALQADAPVASPHPDVVVVRPQGNAAPLFLLAPPEQRVIYFRLAEYVPAGLPLYTVAPPFTDDHGVPLPTVEAFAARAVAAIRSVQPAGPYRVAGYSWAGNLAFEVAQQLADAGEVVEFLGILDTVPPYQGRPTPRRLLDAVRGFSRLAAPRRVAILAEAWRRVTSGGRVRSAYATSGVRYQPRRYPGRVVVFQSDMTVRRWRAPAPYWASLAAEAEVVQVPGTHRSIITGPETMRLIGERLGALATLSPAAGPPTTR